MANRIVLRASEKKLYDSLIMLVDQIQKSFHDYSSRSEQAMKYEQMAKEANRLHMLLRNRNLEPKHHKYMYKNRGVPVEDLEFYNHLHPVEDLLKYIDNPDANNDPEDSTIDEEFNMNIYTRRWGHYDTYTVMRTSTGWRFSFRDTVDCDKECKPGLFDALEHDLVSYPYNIGELIEWVWNKAAEGATKQAVQQAIDDIAEWISTCEKSVPRGMFEVLL